MDDATVLKAFAILTEADQAMADQYLAATRAEAEAIQKRSEAKAALLTALGEHKVGLLPDGRSVRRTDRTIAEATITRKGYTATSLTID